MILLNQRSIKRLAILNGETMFFKQLFWDEACVLYCLLFFSLNVMAQLVRLVVHGSEGHQSEFQHLSLCFQARHITHLACVNVVCLSKWLVQIGSFCQSTQGQLWFITFERITNDCRVVLWGACWAQYKSNRVLVFIFLNKKKNGRPFLSDYCVRWVFLRVV